VASSERAKRLLRQPMLLEFRVDVVAVVSPELVVVQNVFVCVGRIGWHVSAMSMPQVLRACQHRSGGQNGQGP